MCLTHYVWSSSIGGWNVTLSEVAKLLAVVAAAYPGFEVDEIRHNVWSEGLSDLDYQLANLAVRRYIALERFAPTIADIRKQAVWIKGGDAFTGAEAWGEFIAGIRRFGWNRENEAIESFHPRTRRVARLIGWYDACMSENVDVLRGQFLRMYEQLEDRDIREEAASGLMLPRGRVAELAAGIGRAL